MDTGFLAEDIHFMANIPKKIHFIWVGNPIPDKYITNILLWKQKNPEYEINLWIDSDSVAPHQIHCAFAKRAKS